MRAGTEGSENKPLKNFIGPMESKEHHSLYFELFNQEGYLLQQDQELSIYPGKSLHADKVPVSVYDNLIKAVEDNMGALHRYPKGLWGWMTPYVRPLCTDCQNVEMKVPYDRAKEMIAEA